MTENGNEYEKDLHGELVKHLSSEIASEVSYLDSFRSRITFTVLVGPFIVVGSALVALKGPLSFSKPTSGWPWWATVWAFLLYMGLGLYAGLLEKYHEDRCNEWRRAIAMLYDGKRLTENNFLARAVKGRPVLAYMAGFFLVIAEFYCLIRIVGQLAHFG